MTYAVFAALVLLTLAQAVDAFSAHQTKARSYVCMSLAGKLSFLADKDQKTYLSTILRRATDGCKQCLKDGKKLIEVEFPANRKSDLSVSETLDTNRGFVQDFVTSFSTYKKGLWVIFPDRKECSLARSRWGESLPFTLTSIEGALSAPGDEIPELVVAVNPGFNVDEWINLPKATRGAPVIVINGNLDRLRNGYYPAIFYPGLARVTKEYYSKATQALFLSPIAVGGYRLGAWLTKLYPGPWEVLVKGPKDYEIVSSTAEEPPAKDAWSTAKQNYQRLNGGNMF
jgi:hypothetical protein